MMRWPNLRGHKLGPDQLLNRAPPVLHRKISDQHLTTAFLPSDIGRRSGPFHSQIPLTVVLHSTLSLALSLPTSLHSLHPPSPHLLPLSLCSLQHR